MLNIYNGAFIYDFRADNLVCGNQLTSSYLMETISPSLSIPFMLVILYVGLRTCGLPPFTWKCLLLSSLFSSCIDSHVGETS